MLRFYWKAVRPARALFAAFALLLLVVISCSDQTGTGPGGNLGPNGLRFAPRFVRFGPSLSIAPVVNIRLTAMNATTRDVVTQVTLSVDPDADEWDLGLDVPGSAGTVIVRIELLNAENGVEWSGETDPIRVEAGTSSTPPTAIQLYQGPPANLLVTGISLTPAQSEVQEGGAVQLNAAVQPAGIGATVFFTTLDPTIATVSATGQVTTLRNGQARIVAHAGARSDTAIINAVQRVAAITVTPDTTRIGSLGAEFTVTARALDPRGAEINNATIEWSSATPGVVAHVTGNQFRSVANGIATIVARNGAVQGNATVVVAQRATRVAVTPGTATLTAIGATQQFSAALTDASGSPVTAAVVWRSSNPTIVSIDAAGNARALAAGAVEITAVANAGAADEVTGTAVLTVTQAIVSIQLQPSPLSFTAVGDSAFVTATALDANGNAIPNTAFTWTSSDNAVASVVNGMVRATGAGNAQMTALSGNVQGVAPVTVQPAVASLTVTPPNHIFTAIGQTLQLSATARDRNGTQLPAAVEWISSNPALISVDAAGLARAVGSSGTATITATSGSVTATSQLSVVLVTTSIRMEPTSLTFSAINDTARVVATPLDANGNPIVGPAVNWSSSDTLVASVVGGLVRATGPGTAQITALSGNATATITATVGQIAASVNISPDGSVVFTSLDQFVALTSEARDRNGVLITGRRMTFTTSDVAVATVDTLGVVRPVGAGHTRITATLDNATDTLGVDVQLESAEQPNLIVASANIDSGILDDGSTQVVHIQLTNIGTVASELGTVRLRVINAQNGNEFVIQQAAQEPIAAGASLTLTIPFTIDTTLAWSDSIYLTVAADQFNTTAESNETDNLLQTDVYFLRFPVRSVVMTPPTGIITTIGDSLAVTTTAFDRRGQVRADSIVVRVVVDSLQTGEGSGLFHRNRWLVSRGIAAALVEARSLSTGFADTSYVQVRPIPQQVTIVASNVEPNAGDTVRFTGFVEGSNESTLPYPIVWTSLDPNVASIDSTGLATALAGGTARIMGSVSGHWGVVSDTLALTVTVPAVANLRAVSITQYPGGAPTEFSAMYQIIIRNTGTIAASANTVRMMLRNPATGAQLTAREFGINPLAPGDSIILAAGLDYQADASWPDTVQAEVTADALNVIAESDETDNVAVGVPQDLTFVTMQIVLSPQDTTLTAVGDSVRLVATALDRFGRPVVDSVFYRIVVDSSFQEGSSIDIQNNEFAVALRNSPAVRIEGMSLSNRLVMDTMTVRIQQVAQALQISAERDTIYGVQGTLQLTATGVDGNNNQFPVQPGWQSLDTEVVTVTESGLVMSSQLGTGQIMAYLFVNDVLIADTFTVVVAQREQAFVRLEIIPQPVSLIAGDSTRVYTFAYDADSIPTTVESTWRSSDESIFTVDATGLIQAQAVNDTTASLIATYGEFADTTEVHVVVPEGYRVWLGRSNDWFDPNNWSGAQVPDTTEIAYVRAITAIHPVIIGRSVDVGGFVIDPGTTIDIQNNNVIVRNFAYAQGGVSGVGLVIMNTPAGSIIGTFPNLRVLGVVHTAGDVSINGEFEIQSGQYFVGFNTTTVGTNFRYFGGQLNMTDVGRFVVQGGLFAANAPFNMGLMNNGTLEVGGAFSLQDRSTVFAPTGLHRTILNGNEAQQVSIIAPDSATQRFNQLTIANPAGVEFVSSAHINGNLDFGNEGEMTVQQGRTIYTWSALTLTGGSTITNFGTFYYYPQLFTGSGTVQGNPLTPHPPQ